MTDPDHLWHLPTPGLALPAEAVHIWRVSLEQPAPGVRRLAQLLLEDEQLRAERFRFERDRRRFIVSRATLRTILGHYLDLDPQRLGFSYGPRGKPYLPAELNRCELRFNLAHSNELAVYAFAHGCEVGIDVEYVRPLPDVELIASRFFSAGENAVLRKLPPEQRLEGFFNCWTRREAYIKALGDEPAQPLDQFRVSLTPGQPAQLLSVDSSTQEAARWSLAAFVPAPGYVAALAIEGSGYRVEYWQYQ